MTYRRRLDGAIDYLQDPNSRPRPGVDLLPGDAHSLPFPDAHFDLVLLVRVLAHLDQSQRALNEARRMLRPGGQLIVATHPPEHLQRFWQFWPSETSELQAPDEGAWTRSDLRMPISFMRLEDLHTLARNYGLTLPCHPYLPFDDQLALTIWREGPAS